MRLGPRGRSGHVRGDRQQVNWLLLASLAANLLLTGALYRSWKESSSATQELQSELDAQLQETQSQLTSIQANVQSLSTSLVIAKGQLAAQMSANDAQLPAQLPEADPGMTWLTIGMTTVPRKNGADYLSRTLETLMEELPLDVTDPLYRQVRVMVVNNRPGQHAVFDEMKQRIASTTADVARGAEDRFLSKARVYVSMVDNPGTVQDPVPAETPDPNDFDNPKNIPGREVRRQTCDLISMMERAQNTSHYFMFMEDDFRVCPNALHIVHYALRKINAQPKMEKWLALRVSYGMNGILLRTEHLAALSGYLRKHTARLPADLLWMEWIMGRRRELFKVTRGRPLAVFKSNLLDHIGAQSSFAVRANRLAWPGCFDSMASVWSLHKSERFQISKCQHSDISPCPPLRPDDDAWLKYSVPWPHILDGADRDHPETIADVALNVSTDAGSHTLLAT